jgi:hypothetical protein
MQKLAQERHVTTSIPTASFLQEHAQRLHREAVELAAVAGLPIELAQSLSAWQPAEGDARLRIGILGLPDAGQSALARAFSGTPGTASEWRVAPPTGLTLALTDELAPAGPTMRQLEFLSTLDAAIFLHPLRMDLTFAGRRLLSALSTWGIPVQVALTHVDREVPEVEVGRTVLGVTSRLAVNLAALAEQCEPLGVSTMPVALSLQCHDSQGLAGVMGRLWAWAEDRERLAKVRDLRHLAKLLEAAAAAMLPAPPWAVLESYMPPPEAPSLGAPLREQGAFRALATAAWCGLAGQLPAEAPEPAAALACILSTFAEAGFRDRFLTAMPTLEASRGTPTVLLAGSRESALRLMGLIFHSRDRIKGWREVPLSAWLVFGDAPDWLPSDAHVVLQPSETLEAGVVWVIPPTELSLAVSTARVSLHADVIALPRDPRQPLELSAAWAEALADRVGGLLYTCAHAATIPLATLARAAHQSGEVPWFLYDGYDARFTDFWCMAKDGKSLTERWVAARLPYTEPLTLEALRAVDLDETWTNAPAGDAP